MHEVLATLVALAFAAAASLAKPVDAADSDTKVTAPDLVVESVTNGSARDAAILSATSGR